MRKTVQIPVTVKPANLPPIFVTSPLSVVRGSSPVVATDPNGDRVTISLLPGSPPLPSWLKIIDGSLVVGANAPFGAKVTLGLRADDGKG